MIILLKDQLLFHIPDLQANRQGRYVLFAFETNIGSILSEASHYGEAIHLAKAAAIIRQDMLRHKSSFSSNFHEKEFGQVVPISLLQFV